MEDLENNSLLAKWASGNLSEEEKKQLEKEIDLKDLSRVLDDLKNWSVPNFETQKKLEELKQKLQRKKEPKTVFLNVKTWMSVAAGVILILGSFYIYQLIFANQIFSTETGEQITHILPSGSKVVLDAQSELKYRKAGWKKLRKIHIQGQAFIDVTSGSEFIVNTTNGNVKVLGTQFNVLAKNNYLEVFCYEGIVEVSDGGRKRKLHKQQGVRMIDNEVVTLEANNQKPEWIEGYTKFESASLKEVVAEMKKYYNVEIDLPAKYEYLEYSGIMVHNDLDLALEMVFATHGISYAKVDNKVIIK